MQPPLDVSPGLCPASPGPACLRSGFPLPGPSLEQVPFGGRSPPVASPFSSCHGSPCSFRSPQSQHQRSLSLAPRCSRDSHCPCLLPARCSALHPALPSLPPGEVHPQVRFTPRPRILCVGSPNILPSSALGNPSASRQLCAGVYGTRLGLSREKLRYPCKAASSQHPPRPYLGLPLTRLDQRLFGCSVPNPSEAARDSACQSDPA